MNRKNLNLRWIVSLSGKHTYFYPLFLFSVFFILTLINTQIIHETEKLVLNPKDSINYRLSLYPKFTQVMGVTDSKGADSYNPEPSSKEEISAQAAIIMEDESKTVLFEKNSNLRFSMASTTKIMTALTALSYFKSTDILTVREDEVKGAKLGLTEGESFFFSDLLYAMLLPSANDAALTIAQNYPGGESEFIRKMNENAKNWHLFNTHFSDSSGLFDEGNYSTVFDLAQLSSIAIHDSVISKTVSTKSWEITSLNENLTYRFENLNKLLGINGVNGIKTGYTSEAGQVLTTSAVKNGHTYIIVVMKSEDRFLDTQRLLSSLDNTITFQKL